MSEGVEFGSTVTNWALPRLNVASVEKTNDRNSKWRLAPEWKAEMYTLEIAGDPIAITNGAEHEAIRLFNREEFRSELIVLGIVRERSSSEAETKFVVRQSFRKEELVFERDFARASALGEIVRANETCYLAFLVQVGGMLG